MPNRTAQQHQYIPRSVANQGPTSRLQSLLPSILGGLGSAFLGPGGPILGSLVGAGLNFGLNRIESGIQNRYNSPKNTVKRLGEAGLPTAAYLDGGGNQSASSSQQYAQPDLGTAEAISREQVNRMQKQQFELMKREMDLKEQDLKFRKEQTFEKAIQNDYYGRVPEGSQYSHFGTMIESKINMQNAQRFLTEHKTTFQNLDNKLFEALYDTKVGQAKTNLEISKLKPDFMRVQSKLMEANTQRAITAIATDIVRQQAMVKQMSVADQTIAIRSTTEELNRMLLQQIEEKNISPMKSAILKYFLKL